MSLALYFVRSKVRMVTDFGRYGVSATVADTLVSLYAIHRFFFHYFRILPENPLH